MDTILILFVLKEVSANKLAEKNGFLLVFIFNSSLFSGRISEPKRCMKEECATKNSMTLVHNRCR